MKVGPIILEDLELIEGSETSAISFVTPGNYPKENILHGTDKFMQRFI